MDQLIVREHSRQFFFSFSHSFFFSFGYFSYGKTEALPDNEEPDPPAC